MARVDDYQMSFDLSAAELAGRDFARVAAAAGAELAADGSHLSLAYYGRPLAVDRDPLQVRALDDGPALPLAEQALLLHYLERADGTLPSGEWITFREVESGEFYWSAFVKRAKAPLLSFFGERPELLKELGVRVGGRPGQDVGDFSLIVRALPRVEFMLVLWEGDEEFPPEGNVLMDKNVGHYLSTEDIALAAGLPIYKMMASFRR
ncbi:MAG: DUF3786 domain-containing protein [Pseudomonadota bacterium]